MKPYYEHGGVTIYHGDCLAVLPTLPANSVDLILTDPPYFKVKGDAWDNQWNTPTDFLAWLDRVLVEFARVLKPNGSLYLFASPQMGARVECLIATRFEILNSIVWRKPPFSTKADMFEKEAMRAYFPASESGNHARRCRLHHLGSIRRAGALGRTAEVAGWLTVWR